MDSQNSGPDIGTSLALDGNGNVYVAGGTPANGTLDFFVGKYSSAGQSLWVNTYDHQGLYDGALKIEYRNGQLAVSGISQSILGQGTPPSVYWEIATIDLNPLNGQIINVKRTEGSGEGLSMLSDLQFDDDGNLYVCGSVENVGNGLDFKIAKLDSELEVIWIEEYNHSANGDDEAQALTLDAAGNVFVTGTITTINNGRDIYTIKYDNNGNELWHQQYDGQSHGDDSAAGIGVDSNGNVFVAGTSFMISNKDYVLICYAGNGLQIDEIYFNGAENGDDDAMGVSIDNDGSIYVVGQTEVTSGWRYSTVKYSFNKFIDPFHSENLPREKYLEPNLGQLLGTDDDPVSEIQFINRRDYPNSYLQSKKISYVFEKLDPASSDLLLADPMDTTLNYTVIDSLHRVDMVFSDGRSDLYYPIDRCKFYINYFLSHFDERLVPTYEKAIAFEMWNNVDVVVGNTSTGLGLNFICKAGFKKDDISWTYEGADSIAVISNNTLIVYTPFGIISYSTENAYQIATNGNQNNLSWAPQFDVDGNQVRLQLGAYNQGLDLVLKMTKLPNAQSTSASSSGNLEWSTFYGGSSRETFYDVVIDSDEKALVAGESQSTNFPVTVGAFQFEHALNTDIVVIKFNQETLANMWATYYGGEASDRGQGIAADGQGNIVVVGVTFSFDFPIENELQSNNNNGKGALFKLSSNGAERFWGTQFGPIFNSASSQAVSIASNGDTYVIGNASAVVPEYEQSGTTSYGTGAGYILKLSGDGEPLWSTNFGHFAFCRMTGIAIDASNNKYITGGSRDEMPQIGSNPNFNPAYGGSFSDAFLVKLGADDNVVWGSWYGGNSTERGEDIAIASNGNICIAGGTTSNSGFPILNALPNNTTYGGDDGQTPVGDTGHHGDGFIAEFAPDGTHLFGTYFGGSLREACLSVDYDVHNQIYVSGYSGSTSTAWITPSQTISGLFTQAGFNGFGDAFVAALNPNRQLVWGTYFGGGFSEIAYGLATAPNDKLYITGWTESFGGDETGAFPLFEFDPVGGVDFFEDQLNLINDFANEIGDGFVARFSLTPLTSLVGIVNFDTEFHELSIYPNPNNGVFHIDQYALNEKITHVAIFSIDGRKVFDELILQQSEVLLINAERLTSGIYILSIYSPDRVYSGKFIKQ